MSKQYDDILNVQADSLKDRKTLFAEESKENRNRCYEMAERMTIAVAENEDVFQQYLDLQSRFDRYTPNNVLLVMAQNPEAQKLGDYGYWREQGVFVKRKESNHPILIMEPGKEYEREDGSIGTYYNAKKLYDVSQTTARERIIPTETIDDRLLVKALVNNPPANIISADAETMPEEKNAIFVPEESSIYVKRGMDAYQIFKSVVPELVHAGLAYGDKEYIRSDNEFHASCVSYMLCKKYGIDVSDFDFGDAPERFDGMETKEIRSELSKIRDEMNTISSRMVKVLDANGKQHVPSERGSR